VKKILLLLIFTLNSLVFAQPEALFDQHFNDYSENLDDAIDAKKEGIFIFFHMEECPFCQKMRRSVLNQPAVIDYFKTHFLNFEIDIESSLNLTNFSGEDTPEKIFAQHHNLVGATPVLAFFDLTGKRVVRRTGFANEKEFLLLAQYFVEKAYENERFIRYKRRHR
jgi:thioredoxin-related protein